MSRESFCRAKWIRGSGVPVCIQAPQSILLPPNKNIWSQTTSWPCRRRRRHWRRRVDAAAVCAHNAPTPAVNLASNVFAQDQESISGTTPETQAKWRNLLAAQLGNIEDTDDVDSAIAVIVDALCHDDGDVREAAAAAAAAGPDAVSAVACAACRSQDGAADALARALFEDAWALADDATKGLDNIDDIITVLRRHAKKSPRAAETLRALQSGEENKKDDDGDDNRNPAALERLLGDHANKASTPSTGGDAEAEPSKPRTRRRVRKI